MGNEILVSSVLESHHQDTGGPAPGARAFSKGMKSVAFPGKNKMDGIDKLRNAAITNSPKSLI